MPLRAVWLRKRWTRVHIQLDGTVALPQECNCVSYGIHRAGSGVLMFDPLNCPIDDHRIRFMQADDPEALRDRLFPQFDWGGTSDWRDMVTIVDCGECTLDLQISATEVGAVGMERAA